MLDVELVLNIIWFCYFIGPFSSCPCGTAYVCKIITYGRNAAQTQSGERQAGAGETFCGSAYLYWSQFKKALLLPMLLWCLWVGDSLLLAFGNNMGLFVFVANLWRQGEDVKSGLLALVTTQNVLYCWHIITMAAIAEYSVPIDPVLLQKILVENALMNVLILFTILTLLTAGVMIGKYELDKKAYTTPIYGATGAGICLAIVSDAPALLSNSIKAQVGCIFDKIILGTIWIWAVVLMILFISIVESTLHPILIGLWQPAVFGFTSFLFSWQIYGVYESKTIWELKTAFIVLIASAISVLYDSLGDSYHSLKTSNGKPSQLYFIGDEVWSYLTNLRNYFYSSATTFDSAKNEKHGISLSNEMIVGKMSEDIELAMYGNELESPRSEAVEISVAFHAEGSSDLAPGICTDVL